MVRGGNVLSLTGRGDSQDRQLGWDTSLNSIDGTVLDGGVMGV